MRRSHATATWLLERIGLDSALIGDLSEECARGRSTAWYWRQVLLAAWNGIWGTIFHHKLLALRAIATGYAMNALWLFLWSRFLHIGLAQRPVLSFHSIASLFVILITQIATGWVVARTHRAHAVPMVLVFVIWLMTWNLLGGMPELKRLVVNSIDQPRFRAYLAWYLLPISTEVAGLLFGGLIGAHRSKKAPPEVNPEAA